MIQFKVARSIRLAAVLLFAAYALSALEIKIGAEDTITITAVDAEEISKSWRVSASGDLNLPMIGKVHVAGLTVEQAEQRIADLLRRYVKQPHVILFVSEFRSQPVTVTGAVARPGKLQMEGAMTLLDVIARAGGPKDAGPTVTVTRSATFGPIGYPGAHPEQDGRYNVVELKLSDVMDGRGPASTLALKPDDVVYLSEQKQPKMVHISGEVNKPGAVELVIQDRISIKKVVALAGGFTRTASPAKTMIVHVNDAGVQTSAAMIDLKKMMDGRIKDLELTPGDIVMVPSSQLMTFVQAASMSAITTGIFILGKY